MARRTVRKTGASRAAIYSRVSDKSQAAEDRTSLSEQVAEMERYCEERGMAIAARYQEVGRGWSKKRPEFQRMLEDARKGLFETIVCWKSDRLSRGVYPAAALMEVVEAYGIELESVMDAIDMKTFGLMAAIGKIELDGIRERTSMGRRGAAKKGRVPAGRLPYGYRAGEGGRPEIVEEQAEVVRRIFRMYLSEGMGTETIARRLTEEGIPPARSTKRWHHTHVSRILSNEAYKGVWNYGRGLTRSTEDGIKIFDQPRESWIEVAVPPAVDEESWDRAQRLKKERRTRSKRNTKTFYLLQHLMRCTECGMLFGAHSSWTTSSTHNGRRYRYELKDPLRYYRCYGVQQRLRCRERPYIRAERLEGLVWSEVRGVLRNPELILAGIESMNSQVSDGVSDEIASHERGLKRVRQQEERVIDLYVTGRITESQFERQRALIAERLEDLRMKLDDCRGRQTIEADRRETMESILSWAEEIGDGADGMAPEQRRNILLGVVEGITIDRHNEVSITLAVPGDDSLRVEGPSPHVADGWRQSTGGLSCSPRRWRSTPRCAVCWRSPRSRTSTPCGCPWQRL